MSATPALPLRAKFVAILLLGGALIAAVGISLSYAAVTARLGDEFAARGGLLAGAITHASSIARTDEDLRQVVQAVLADENSLRAAMIVAREDGRIIVSSRPDLNNAPLARLNDPELSAELRGALVEGRFGHHLHAETNELRLFAPLYHRPKTERPDLGPSGHRGVIYLALDAAAYNGAIAKALWCAVATVLLVVGLMILFAYLLLERQVIGPILAIRQAVTARGQGDRRARIQTIGRDEIGALARTFNEMSDAVDGIEGHLRRARRDAVAG